MVLKRTKSCRTLGDFCLSVHLSVCPSVVLGSLRRELWHIGPEILFSGLKFALKVLNLPKRAIKGLRV